MLLVLQRLVEQQEVDCSCVRNLHQHQYMSLLTLTARFNWNLFCFIIFMEADLDLKHMIEENVFLNTTML